MSRRRFGSFNLKPIANKKPTISPPPPPTSSRPAPTARPSRPPTRRTVIPPKPPPPVITPTRPARPPARPPRNVGNPPPPPVGTPIGTPFEPPPPPPVVPDPVVGPDPTLSPLPETEFNEMPVIHPHRRTLGLRDALIGGALGFVTGGPGGAAVGALGGLLGKGSEPPQGTPTIPGNFAGNQCPQGTFELAGRCIDVIPGGANRGDGIFVPPVPGRPGLVGQMGAWEPQVMTQTTRRCGPGAVLGMDGLCYDRRAISNRQRMWPKGRKPLLTGGEMAAISKAARAARRVNSTRKRLKKLGMLK